MLLRKKNKFVCVLQHDEEDCGPACIASVAKYFGKNFTISRLRELTGTGQTGTTLLGLKRGAENLGFTARCLKVNAQNIDTRLNLLPGIIHWNGNHFVVIFGKERGKYVIADPSVGLRYLSKQELMHGWKTGVILSLFPDLVNFYQHTDDKVKGFQHFFKKLALYKGIITEILLINLTIGIIALVSPLLIQFLTDDILIKGDTALLTRIAIAVIIMKVISYFDMLFQSLIINWLSQKIEISFILKFVQTVLRLPLSYYEQHRSGEIISRLDDISVVNQLISQFLINLFSRVFVALIALGLMFRYSPKLTLVSLGICIGMLLTTVVFYRPLEQKTRNMLILEAENQGILVEAFKGSLTLKTSGAFPQFWEELQERIYRLGNLTIDTLKIIVINHISSQGVADLGHIAILWYGSYMVINHQLTLGQLLAFYAMSENVTYCVTTVVEFIDEFIRAKTAMQRLTEIIDTKTEVEGDTQKAWVRIPEQADITFHNIIFHYVGRINLLENFSLHIPGGKTTAIIGESGCGKSTIAKLIAGLYPLQPQNREYNNSGQIFLGNYSLQDLSLDCLRQQVILVPQEAHFWSRTIIDNFRLGNPELTDQQIFYYCALTNAHSFISKLPSSYQTVLGEFGTNISGGQRQRLAIAKALAAEPAILILDESTSSLDPQSEAEVLARILEVRKGKTTILISHRERVFLQADWIIQLQNGQLAQAGEPSLFNTLSYLTH